MSGGFPVRCKDSGGWHIKGLLALSGFLLLVLSTGAQALGYVHALTGTATVRRTPTEQDILRVGNLVHPGQTVVTEANSTAIIKFEDGQVMTLSPGSSFVIRDYAYNKQQVSASRMAFELLRGGLRFVTGVIGSTNRDAVRIRAGTATIGVRGTDGTLVFNPSTGEVTATVGAGLILVSTPRGAQTVSPGTFTRATPASAPTPLAPVTQAPPAAQQVMTGLAAAPIPVNTPVNVQASARAAVLVQQASTNPALQQQAAQAVAEAVAAAQVALQTAVQAGAVPPAPPAPSPTPSSAPAPSSAAPAAVPGVAAATEPAPEPAVVVPAVPVAPSPIVVPPAPPAEPPASKS